MATQTSTQRQATARKAAATRKRNAARRSQAARKAAETRAQAELTYLGVLQAQVERAVLIPVGAALVARDTLLEASKPFTTRESATREIRRFERRGATARNRVKREVKRARTRVERELRQRRTRIEREVRGLVKDFETRAEPVTKNVELVQARLENAYESGRTAATKASTTVQERIAALA